MSPIIEPTVLDLRRYTLRLVGPRAVVFPNALETNVTVLNRTDMVARPLPSTDLPTDPDFVQGQWTGRLYDAGDAQLTFPNREASDGVPWRDRFDPTNKLQWVEVYLDEYLESVFCITKVAPYRDRVEVSGYDGMQMLKSAYTRDWVCLQSPRDVIERGTQVWVPTTTDNFPYVGSSTPSAQWTVSVGGSGTATITVNGGCLMSQHGVGGSTAQLAGATVTVPLTRTWTAQCYAQALAVTSTNDVINFGVTESDGRSWMVQITDGQAFLIRQATVLARVVVAPDASYSLQIESDGEWVSGFINGRLIGSVRRDAVYGDSGTSSLAAFVQVSGGDGTVQLLVTDTLVESLRPFLQRGSDKGDYVLPGSASTYPTGGLHARYFNNLDLQSDANRLPKIHSPPRTQAFAGSGTSEYQNQQDATINGQANPLPGAATSGWSCIWFGAIYLKVSAGNYTMQINAPGNIAQPVAWRVYIGKTKFGDALATYWPSTPPLSSPSATTFTVSASALAGSLPYGGGTMWRDGWYPIKVEYAVDGTAEVAPALYFMSSPTSYTDPGGTAVASGAQTTIVPATSLSPLGMVDQRYQATSHFDMAQKTAYAFGYQMAVEPQSLESGLFPGVLAPRIREGQDYDPVLEPDDSQRKEGILNYCVDAETECLTKRGWRQHHELLPDDELLAFDAASRSTRWERPKEVYVNPNYRGDMIFLGTEKHFGALTTPEHRWPVYSAHGDRLRVLTSETLSKTGYIPRHAPYRDFPTTPTYRDAVVRLVAWYVTEGHLHSNGLSMLIAQSPTANPGYVDEIRADLHEVGSLGGMHSSRARGGQRREGLWFCEYAYEGHSTRFEISGCGADEILAAAPGKDKVPTMEFLLSLTAGQLEMFVETCLKGDGTYRRRTFHQWHVGRMDAFAIAVVLMGRSPYLHQSGTSCRLVKVNTGTHVGGLSRQRAEYVGTVWCPVTDSGFWVARRRGKVFITGNSDLVDGTDQISSIAGNGAGFQNGSTGQLQASVFDAPTLQNALFDMQGWQDAADASFPSLLQATLNSELGLRLVPWEVLSADPVGRSRLADTFPVSGALSAFRWRPGDGVRVLARDIGVNDTVPRQLLLVTRSIGPNGVTGTQVGFAARPKSNVYANRRTLSAALRPQRNYQKQMVTLVGNYAYNGSVAAGANTSASGSYPTNQYSSVVLLPADIIVRARVRIVVNGAALSTGLAINGSGDVTSILGGPWTTVPVNIDITAVAVPDANNRLLVALINKGVSPQTQLDWQLFVDVLR